MSTALEKSLQVRTQLISAGHDAAKVDAAIVEQQPRFHTDEVDALVSHLSASLGAPANGAAAAGGEKKASPTAQAYIDRHKQQVDGAKTWGL
jgi:hypothetical protein